MSVEGVLHTAGVCPVVSAAKYDNFCALRFAAPGSFADKLTVFVEQQHCLEMAEGLEAAAAVLREFAAGLAKP